MTFYFIGNGQRKNSLLTYHHFVLLRLKQKKCFSRRLWCHFSIFLQRGKTIHCIQVYDILWNHNIVERERKYHFTVDTYPNHWLQGVVLQVGLHHLLYKHFGSLM